LHVQQPSATPHPVAHCQRLRPAHACLNAHRQQDRRNCRQGQGVIWRFFNSQEGPLRPVCRSSSTKNSVSRTGTRASPSVRAVFTSFIVFVSASTSRSRAISGRDILMFGAVRRAEDIRSPQTWTRENSSFPRSDGIPRLKPVHRRCSRLLPASQRRLALEGDDLALMNPRIKPGSAQPAICAIPRTLHPNEFSPLNLYQLGDHRPALYAESRMNSTILLQSGDSTQNPQQGQ
jgi:hypothetical protein